jgi:hypothetical protein
MGLRREYLDFIERSISQALANPQERSMLELGDQLITDDSAPETTGKEYFQNRGFTHVSIDLNGLHGSLSFDLSRPIPRQDWLGAFDVITNAGTSEHVEPFKGQHACFKNIHDLLALGGIAIHLVPDVDELEQRGHWMGHSNYYYSEGFFRALADENGYRLVSSEVIHGLRCACLQKTDDQPFTADVERFLSGIARRSGGRVYPGINDSRLVRPFRRAFRAVVDATKHLAGGLVVKGGRSS